MDACEPPIRYRALRGSGVKRQGAPRKSATLESQLARARSPHPRIDSPTPQSALPHSTPRQGALGASQTRTLTLGTTSPKRPRSVRHTELANAFRERLAEVPVCYARPSSRRRFSRSRARCSRKAPAAPRSRLCFCPPQA